MGTTTQRISDCGSYLESYRDGCFVQRTARFAIVALHDDDDRPYAVTGYLVQERADAVEHGVYPTHEAALERTRELRNAARVAA